MTEDELRTVVATNYPEIYALINQPGIWQVMQQAFADPTHPWNASQIEQAIQQTPYWKNTSVSARQWDIIVATDPATARQKGDEATAQVLHLAQTLGITLTPENQWDLVVNALQQGWGDAEIKHALLFGAAFTGLQPTATGDIAGTAQGVKALAAQYGVPLSDQSAGQWALGVQDGVVTNDALKAYMISQAKSLYPELGTALDQGITVQQYTAPYQQIAQQELGINASDYNLSDPKWATALQQIDPKTGERTAMTLAQWQQHIRSDPAYGYATSAAGTQSASQLAAGLAQRFGVTG